MYFWKDDFALMIKAQNPEEAVGFFGPGLKGDGAYRYITIPFALLYPTFGLNAFWYFLVGILLYFLATAGVFYLALEVFNNRFKAFLAALIFASGYIGADSIFGLTNSYQTSWVILSLTFCLKFFIRSFNSNGFGFYLTSIFLFMISLETGYIRAHGFFLIVLSTAILVIDKISFKKIPEFILKIIPYFLIFKHFYLSSAPAQVGSSQFSKSIESGNYDYFYNPLITFINVFIPTPLLMQGNKLFNDLLNRNTGFMKFQLLILAAFLLLLFILIIFFYLRKYFDKNSENVTDLRVLLFSLGTIAGSFLGVFYIGAASTYLESTHRYLSTALIGAAFFWVSIFSLIFSKTKKNDAKVFVSVLTLCVLLIFYGNTYALESINTRTKPQKDFFSQLKKEIPEIKDKTFLYFDVSNKNNSNGKFGNIFGAGSVGGSAEITMHYPGVDRYEVVTSINDFQDFARKINREKGDIENSHWFYFEDNKLTNKTEQFRQILNSGKTNFLHLKQITHEVKLIKKADQFEIENTSLEVDLLNLPSLSDGILKFNLTVQPNEPLENSTRLPQEDEKYLQYLLTKSRIKGNSKALVLNNFQNHYPENLFDGKLETAWMADRGPWHNLTHGITDQIQFIEISIDEPINLGGVLFTNGHSLRTPTSYRFLIKENNNWKEIKKTEFKEAKATNEIWFDGIGPVLTKDLRIELFNSSSGDAPQLAELELVDAQFKDLDFKRALAIETDPSLLLKKYPNSPLVKDYFGLNGKLSFVYLSDKDNDYNSPAINFGIKGFDQTYNYEIKIPAGGTHLIKGKFFNLNFPAKYIFSDFEFINPRLSYYLDKL